ncbi:hypothetical protein WJX72_004116 [[Myrmecia] bisecta]|uniref:Tubulin epsilon and delta complex protein 1 domain-containing protein n=1 Tax=[Myrmecia] bisecta TaxID=41462 RepID=A0AAW1PFD6_9CHLO
MDAPQAQGVKAALSYTCKLLSSLGIQSLTAETLRQAKFDGHVCASLWRAVHDLVLLQLASFPHQQPGTLLDAFWEQVMQETVLDGFPWEGAQMVQAHLQAWGCPIAAAFAAEIDSIRSRTLLLAFGWLISHCSVFQRGLQGRITQLELAAPLPPYPEDTLGTDENLHAGEAARRVAAGYVQKALNCCGGLQGWEQVEAANHHALMLYGRTRAKLNRLAALHQTHVKHLHQLSSLQQQALSGWEAQAPITLASWRKAVQQQTASIPAAVAGHSRAFPEDIQAAVEAVQQQNQQRVSRLDSLASIHSAAPVRHVLVNPEAAADGMESAVAEAEAVHVAQAEISRLKGAVLLTAKMLARTRATNKQALRSVLEGLGGEQIFLGL